MNAKHNLLIAALLVLSVVQAAFLFHTRGQVSELSQRLQQVEVARAAAPSGSMASAAAGEANSAVAGAQGTGGTALSAALRAPETRDYLQQLVAAQLQRERDEQKEQQRRQMEEFEKQRDQFEKQRAEQAAAKLGLNADERHRFIEAANAMQNSRKELARRVRDGQLQPDGARNEFQALTERGNQQLRQVLGEERMKQYQELMRGPIAGMQPPPMPPMIPPPTLPRQ